MSIAVARINELILEQLARREMRVLSLVVAIRNDLSAAETFKGDLTASVKAALRKLVFTKAVVDVEGMYTLAPSMKTPEVKAPGAAGHP